MQHAFSCVSSVCKHLQRLLAADIPTVQDLSAPALTIHMRCVGSNSGSYSGLFTPVPDMLFTPCSLSKGA